MAAVRAGAGLPDAAHPDLPVAPARGAVVVTVEYEAGNEGFRKGAQTQDGFHPVRKADAFDRMAFAARGRSDVPLFTVAQVRAGRAYAALFERCASEGIRCASGEAMGRGGGGEDGRDWITGVIARSDRLAGMRAVLSDDVVLAAGDGRRVQRVRDVVDAVCLEGLMVAGILRRAGWPVHSDHYRVVQVGLRRGLDALAQVCG